MAAMKDRKRRRLSRLDGFIQNGTVEFPPIWSGVSRFFADSIVPSTSTSPPPIRWELIHIPKTAGDSFITQSPRHMPKGSSLKGNEEQGFQSSNVQYPTITLFRHPTKQVLSQFLECKYDTWGRRQTNGLDFPGYFQMNDTMAGFDPWIEHFMYHAYHPTAQRTPYHDQSHYGPIMAFRCYDPFNMQSRYLTAGRQNKWPHFAYQHSHRFPPLDVALKHLGRIQVVGIVKYFAASICLFEYHAGGGQFLTEHCQYCREDGVLDVARMLEHESHLVPPHSIDMLSKETLQLIENNMTTIDQELYDAALRRFLVELDQIWNTTGVDLLCRDKSMMNTTTLASNHVDSLHHHLGYWIAIHSFEATPPIANFGLSLVGYWPCGGYCGCECHDRKDITSDQSDQSDDLIPPACTVLDSESHPTGARSKSKSNFINFLLWVNKLGRLF